VNPIYVYIGLPGYAGQETGYFGKPWACLKDPDGWQAGFLRYLTKRLDEDPVFAGAVAALHGHQLVCFCKHKRGGKGADQPCHGDALATVSEWLWHGMDRPTAEDVALDDILFANHWCGDYNLRSDGLVPQNADECEVCWLANK
jgi:hypothetical protein